eukprot:m.120575 g.120575  ORF g.120575 m.120575 type:complete len:661 (-) comp14559_c0_seq1:895-2877(-)
MQCHYEVLGVSRDVTEIDLKKAYKAMALKCHPDKNRDNPEEATKRFQLVQAAYAVLNDPQERAWYDNHREAILRGGTGVGGEHEEGVDVMPYFSPSAYTGFGDDEEGFYRVYAKLFQEISEDEIKNGEHEEHEASEAPTFGTSASSYEQVVRPFYAYWENFVSTRGFHAQDKWDLREAEDRRVKRLMEKENKKLRDAARKEYNINIRELAAYVKKRDPRLKEYLARRREEQEQKERLEKERKLESARKGKVVTHSVLDADHQHGLDALDNHIDSMFGIDPDEQELEGGMFCPACGKAFKSAKQWDNHKRSKKHLAAVERLKEVLQVEDLEQTGDGRAASGSAGSDVGEGEGQGESASAAAAAAEGESKSASEPEDDEEEDDPTPPKSKGKKGKKASKEAQREAAVQAAQVTASKKKQKKKNVRRVTLDDDEDEESASSVPRAANPDNASTTATAAPQSENVSDGEEQADGVDKQPEGGKATGTEKQQDDAQNLDDEEDTLAAMLGRMGTRGRGNNKGNQARSAPRDEEDEEDVASTLLQGKARRRRKGRDPYEAADAEEAGRAAVAAAAVTAAGDEEDEGEEAAGGKKAKGKKAREAKRAQSAAKAQAEFDTEGTWGCNVCGEVFGTRNKLFQHVNEMGHALRKEDPTTTAQGRKGKKGK